MMLVINLLTNKYIVPIISCVYVGGCLLALAHHAYVLFSSNNTLIPTAYCKFLNKLKEFLRTGIKQLAEQIQINRAYNWI